MTPADIAGTGLRAGLARRLAELGLVPPAAPPAPADGEERKAA